MQYSKKYRKINGFTLIESMLGLMVIGFVSGSLMLGITTVEKKLFKIRLKEQAFETLRNWTNFLGSKIAVGEIPLRPPDSGFDVAIYINPDNILEDVYTANMNYIEIKSCCSFECCVGSWTEDPEAKYCGECQGNCECNGRVYYLETSIEWPNEFDIKETLTFKTYQIELTK